MAGTIYVRRTVCTLAAVMGVGLLVSCVQVGGTSLETAPDEPWAQPTDRALNNLGPSAASSNVRPYDCSPMSYRMIDDLSKTMHQGCFVTAAFGLFDPDQDVAIFNNTDEAESIRQNGQEPALQVLPFSATVAQFSGFPVEGTYMHLYTYFPGQLSEARDSSLRRYKQITGSPDMTVTDNNGQPLAVNPEALAYAPRGQWMVTESPGHSLVRVNLATYSVLPFAPSFDIAGKPYASHSAQMAISGDGRYAAVASSEFSSFKVYDLASCKATGTNDGLAPETCKSSDYWPYTSSQITGTLRGITHIRFVTDDILSFDVSNEDGTTSYELSPSGPITSLISYLGLGDSYAAGQGAGNYAPGTDTPSNSCHLSGRSYPLLLNSDVFSGAGHSVACTGATIADVGSQSATYTGQTTDQRSVQARDADGSSVSILHDFTPGYLSQQTFVENYQPGIITVEIGGNDVGFRDMLIRCVSPLAAVDPLKANPNNCYTSYEDRLEVEQTIDQASQKWINLYQELQRTAPAAKIYAIGYPQIVDSSGSCGLNVHLTRADIGFTRDVIAYLNGTIAKAAQAAGVQYVDISDALAGHELCDSVGSEPGMNGLTAGGDEYGVFSKESYHPTAFGQQLMEQAILRATDHFASATRLAANPNIPVPTPSDGDSLLQAPKSGRSTTTIVPDDGMTAGSTTIGSTITIHITSDTGLQPQSTYTVQIGTTVLGNIKSNDDGSITSSLPVPDTTSPGNQPVSVSGLGQNGDPTTVTTVTYVDTTSQDYDGDGIPNSQDSCPFVINSGIDSDKDGIDDACDTTIAPSGGGTATPPSNGAGTGTTSPSNGQTGTNPQAQNTATQQSATTASPTQQGSASGNQVQPTTDDGVNPENDNVSLGPIDATIYPVVGVGSSLAAHVSRTVRPTANASGKLTIAQPTSSHLRSTPLPQSATPKTSIADFKWYLWLLLIMILLAVWRCSHYVLQRKRRPVDYRRLMYS